MLAGFLLGLSTGVFCLSWCIPFIAPYLVSEERNFKKNFKIILEFIFGRLGGYIIFGAIFGYFGQKLNNQTVNLVLISSLMVLSLILVIYALGFLKPKGIFCSSKLLKFRTKAPILMGFLMGVNICPPFLMSLAYVFTLGSALKGVLYFLMFFLGTAVYFLPAAFLGFLGKMKEFRLIARISGLIIGLAFLIYGIYYIVRGLSIIHYVG